MAMKLNKAKSTDGKGLQAHFKGLDKAKKHVTIGIQADAQDYADGTPILKVAISGEYGNARAHVKPRHFLSLSILKDKNFYLSKTKAILKYYKKGETNFINVAMTELGRQGVEKVQKNIEQNTIGMHANSENTAYAKGGNQPMVDSGHLVRQITYKAEGGHS